MTKIYNKRIVSLILALIIIASSAFGVSAAENTKVCPGGMPFGVKFYTDGVIVSAIEEIVCESGTVSPAESAGINIKDIITHVNNKKVATATAVSDAVAKSGGSPIVITVQRGDQTLSLTLTPAKSPDGKYKAGLWLRDNTAGVGTVTYINPDTGEFAGLGHGICDCDTGRLLPLLRGSVMNVSINGIKRGLSGAPGELRGSLGADKLGVLTKNSNTGVYGVMTSIPSGIEPIEIGTRDDLHEGEAKIICTLDNEGAKEYDVMLTSIERCGRDSKNFIVCVTDKALLEKTGGIIQGMSGSPIIQDGKLVGAVTHVLVNDPTRGYGIFIENMLEAAG
ncbi:MAG: SpoIVB peptidase [Ruminococcaceae bacterium]|nr:SpoIVB peptidase [Oscillospiraceae bacterium]